MLSWSGHALEMQEDGQDGGFGDGFGPSGDCCWPPFLVICS